MGSVVKFFLYTLRGLRWSSTIGRQLSVRSFVVNDVAQISRLRWSEVRWRSDQRKCPIPKCLKSIESLSVRVERGVREKTDQQRRLLCTYCYESNGKEDQTEKAGSPKFSCDSQSTFVRIVLRASRATGTGVVGSTYCKWTFHK